MSVSSTIFGDYRGLSTDEKPVKNVPNGSVYYEIDTRKVFMFDLDSAQWIEQ